MHAPSRRTTHQLALAAGLAAGVVAASATAIYAVSLEPDGVVLRATWSDGGEGRLELEDRNVHPVICFVWDHEAPQDGDSTASRVLTRTGTEVLDLGTGDQWIDGSTEGCEIPRNSRYRDVFAHPSDYIVEFRVVENQGTPATAPVRSAPLRPDSG